MITVDAREYYEPQQLLCAANKRRMSVVIKIILHALHKCHREHEGLHIPTEQRWLAYLQ